MTLSCSSKAGKEVCVEEVSTLRKERHWESWRRGVRLEAQGNGVSSAFSGLSVPDSLGVEVRGERWVLSRIPLQMGYVQISSLQGPLNPLENGSFGGGSWPHFTACECFRDVLNSNFSDFPGCGCAHKPTALSVTPYS